MGKVIMVVDDVADERKLVRLLLRRFNCTLIEVANAVDAVKLAHKHRPQLVLMDHMMPQMSGYECIYEFRQDLDLSRIPIIMLTARKFDEGFKNFMKQEINDFLPKPVDANALLDRIQGLIGKLEPRAAPAA